MSLHRSGWLTAGVSDDLGGARLWEAHVRQTYAVENLADRMIVTVRNGSVPLTLTVRADGSLGGSGTVEVTGRVLTGMNDSVATFSPLTTRCAVSVLTTQ